MPGIGSVGGAELLIVLVFFAVLILLVIRLLARSGTMSSNSRANEPTAKEVLDRRYASGEMPREEYLRVRDDITRGNDA